MSAARFYLGRAAALIRTALRVWSGDDDYQRYLHRCEARREPPLDRGRYLARRLEERYSTPTRCC